jgi:hypothetical protein
MSESPDTQADAVAQCTHWITADGTCELCDYAFAVGSIIQEWAEALPAAIARAAAPAGEQGTPDLGADYPPFGWPLIPGTSSPQSGWGERR